MPEFTMTVQPAFLESESVAFTFDWYERLLQWLLEHGFDVDSYEGGLTDGSLVLRHDVDLSPRKALVMGQLEADLGVSSTYFFLVTSPLYNVLDEPNREILAELTDLGHRVGVHFNTHQYWTSEPPLEDLRTQIEETRTILSIATESTDETISFHCPPDWVLNRRFDGVRSAYEPRFFSEIAYSADSGQRWRDGGVLSNPLPKRLQLLTHPGLWGTTDEQYIPRVMSETKTNLDRTEHYITRAMFQDRFDAIGYPYGDITRPETRRT